MQLKRDESFEDDDDFGAAWTGGRMNRNPGVRKMAPAERPQSDRARQANRNRARAGKDFNRHVNG